MIEYEGWPHLGFLEVVDLENARVRDTFENPKLAMCLAHASCPRFGARCLGHGLDAHTSLHSFHADVLALPVLVAFTFTNQLNELVVAHLAMLVRRSDSDIGQSARNRPRLLTIDSSMQGVAANAVGEGCNDTIVVLGVGLAPHKGRRLCNSLKLAFQAGRRKENHWFHEGEADFCLDYARLTPQQARQALRFTICQNKRIVVGVLVTVSGPRPGVRI